MKTSLKQLEMHKEFIPYEEALAMKELGFKEPCLKYYFEDRMLCKGFALMNWNNQNGCFNAPLYQQAFRWFREKYKLKHSITTGIIYSFTIDNKDYGGDDGKNWFNSYEEAELACLRKLIEIVKE